MKKFIPFIREGLVLLFVFLVFLSAILCASSIIVAENLLFWSAISCLFFALFYCISPLKQMLLLFVDLVFNQRRVIKGIITDIVPMKASCFSEKWKKYRIRSTDTTYCLLIEVKDEKIPLLARDNALLVKNEKLNIQYGRFSHVVLNVRTLK